MAGLWVGQAYGGVPPTWVWVVGVSPQILEHPTSICDTGVNICLNSLSDRLLHQGCGKNSWLPGELNRIVHGLFFLAYIWPHSTSLTGKSGVKLVFWYPFRFWFLFLFFGWFF